MHNEKQTSHNLLDGLSPLSFYRSPIGCSGWRIFVHGSRKYLFGSVCLRTFSVVQFKVSGRERCSSEWAGERSSLCLGWLVILKCFVGWKWEKERDKERKRKQPTIYKSKWNEIFVCIMMSFDVICWRSIISFLRRFNAYYYYYD